MLFDAVSALALVLSGGGAGDGLPELRELRGCYLDEQAGCRERRIGHNLRLYGGPRLEQLQRQGLAVRSIFWVDYFNRDVGMLTITKRDGQPARALYQPAGDRDLRPLRAELPDALWEEIRREWKQVDMVEEPDPGEDDGGLICHHAWLIGFAAAEPGAIHRRTTNRCSRSLGPAFSLWVAEQVGSVIPACAPLKEREIDLLSGCAWLRGNRESAAHVSASLELLVEPGSAAEAAASEALFANAQALGRWRAICDDENSSDWSIDRVTGRSSDVVEVKGRLNSTGPDGNGRGEAPFTMRWQRGAAGRFRVADFEVGRFRPVSQSD